MSHNSISRGTEIGALKTFIIQECLLCTLPRLTLGYKTQDCPCLPNHLFLGGTQGQTMRFSKESHLCPNNKLPHMVSTHT